jgi:hypothetical protein
MSWFQHCICFHSVKKYAGKFSQVADMQEAKNLVMRHHLKKVEEDFYV